MLIISDDQAWNDYSHTGHQQIETPRLDALAAESVTFTRGYVSSPLCRPSLASILTGLPTHVHGITGNDPATGDRSIHNMASRRYPRHDKLHNVLYDRLDEQPNFVKALAGAGYATLQTGKWWEQDPKRYGFSHAMTHGDPRRGARHGDAGLVISRKGIGPIREFLDEVTTGEGSRPFFIWHAPLLPHTPHSPPKALLEKYEKLAPTKPTARYWAMCEWFDQTCGELLDEIAGRGFADSTAVLYVTDNGWIQDPGKMNKFQPRSKNSPYEGGIRTPISVRMPGVTEPRRDEETLVAAIDLPTTILRLAGIDVPAEMRGIDLLDTQRLVARDAVFGSEFPHNIADVRQPDVGWDSRYVVSGGWKLIDHANLPDELFDVKNDPSEERNLFDERPAVAERLQLAIDRWWSRDQ
ncbi:MAG: sulfatase-like hydrolase/transferase [Planctomycetota bacterium]